MRIQACGARSGQHHPPQPSGSEQADRNEKQVGTRPGGLSSRGPVCIGGRSRAGRQAALAFDSRPVDRPMGGKYNRVTWGPCRGGGGMCGRASAYVFVRIDADRGKWCRRTTHQPNDKKHIAYGPVAQRAPASHTSVRLDSTSRALARHDRGLAKGCSEVPFPSSPRIPS